MATSRHDRALGDLARRYETLLRQEEEARRAAASAAQAARELAGQIGRIEESLRWECRAAGLAEPPSCGERLDFGWIRRRLDRSEPLGA